MSALLAAKPKVSTHSRPKAAGAAAFALAIPGTVSTHSRPKAAGHPQDGFCAGRLFQHTAARRRLVFGGGVTPFFGSVSTHSRPKAAGKKKQEYRHRPKFQHTAARRRLVLVHDGQVVNRGRSFNTQPPEGGWYKNTAGHEYYRSFNTQPPEGGWKEIARHIQKSEKFQHTAARRRLGSPEPLIKTNSKVSTHSRPKAAGETSVTPSPIRSWFQHTAARRRLDLHWGNNANAAERFNTQPPEGGWYMLFIARYTAERFQHTAARRRLAGKTSRVVSMILFQHTAARRRLGPPSGG